MAPSYVICIDGFRWVTAILKSGVATTDSRHEALRFKDANVALTILTMVESANAFVEEINEVITKIER
jgi:hypothetical protein